MSNKGNDKPDKSEEKDRSHEIYTNKNFGKRNSEELPEREGSDEGKTIKPGSSYEPDKAQSGTQGGYGQGNAISKGSEGAQGYGITRDDTGDQ